MSSDQGILAFVWTVVQSRRYELGFIAGAILFEVIVRTGAARRLASRGYVVDLIYCAFYRLGIFTVMLDAPVQQWVGEHLHGQLLPALPVWARMIAYLILLDFTNYWVHRIEHRVPWLWAFHQVHHSQEHLTIMTTYRNHPLDVWMRSVIAPVIFMVLLGIPPALWFPLSLLWDVNLNLSHLDVPWTYGPFRWVLVSPVFHAVHHSVDAAHQNRNYGMTLSIWDRLFGTAAAEGPRPTRFGLPGWKVRESFLTHCWVPVRAVSRHYRGLADPELAPLGGAPPADTGPVVAAPAVPTPAATIEAQAGA